MYYCCIVNNCMLNSIYYWTNSLSLSLQVKHVVIELPVGCTKQTLGFSIRGGAEHGIGIYVSYVDICSVAERHGIRPGDHILSVNGVSFERIPHEQAAQVH